MADQNTNTPPVQPAPDNSKVNAELAAKVAAQDIMGQSLATTSKDAGPALDELAKQYEEEQKKKAEAAAAPKPEVKPEVTPEPEVKPEVKEPTPEEKEAAAKAEAAKAATAATEEARAKELFKDAPTLPQGAAPKSHEAFATIKLTAAREIARVEQELQKTRDELKTIKDASAHPTTAQLEQEKELTELRQWRAKMDVEFDPKFKEFDKTIEGYNDFIYAQLRKSPVVSEDLIAKIKGFGGPAKTNLSKLFESMADPTLQRVIESKVSDILVEEHKKQQAIKSAKDNILEYSKARQAELNSAVTGHVTATKQALDQMLPNLEWFKDKEVKGTEAEQKTAQDHNNFVGELRKQLDEALADDSPQMRAILITGMAQLFNTQRVNNSLTAELEAVKKENTALKEKWAKIKESSKSRLNESGAPTTVVPQPPKVNQFTTPAGDALDAIAKQVMEQRQAKGTGATV